MARVLEALRRVRRRLAREGWIRGNMHTERGYCMLGVLRAEKATPLLSPILERGMYPQWGPPSGSTYSRIMAWNDELGRNKEQVFALLDGLIAKFTKQRIERRKQRARREARRALQRIQEASKHIGVIRAAAERAFQPARARGEKCLESK